MPDYLEVFQDSQETQYDTGKYPLMSLAQQAILNKKIRFRPLGPWNDGTTDDLVEYNIQRVKRIKGKKVDNQGQPKGAGSDYIALMDSATKIEFVTITTKIAEQDQLLIKVKKGSRTEALEDASVYDSKIATKTENKLITKEEQAVAEVVTAGTEVVIDLSALNTKDEAYNVIADVFSNLRDDQEDLVDDFKYNGKSITLYNTRIGKVFSRLQGRGYQQGTNTFGDAFKDSFTFENQDFLAEDVFKSIVIPDAVAPGTDADKVILGITMNDEAYANSGLEQGHIEVSEPLVRNDVIGHLFDSLSIIVDSNRINYVTCTIADLKKWGIVGANFKTQAKVND